jgi:uncharacterized protein (DUF2141 family)
MTIRTSRAMANLLALCVTVASLALPHPAGAQGAAAPPRDVPMPRPTGTASIAGVVRTADETGAPVRRARVTLNSLDRGGPSAGSGRAETATTDAEGRFVFRDLPAGRYAVQASKRAWLDANYGAARLGRPGTPVAVRAGETIANVEIRMARGAVIAGAVRDESGEPQPGVWVRVLQFVTRDGARALERPASANTNDPITDDEGAYRVFGLPPGDYLVVAGLRFSQGSGLGGDEVQLMAAASGARGATVTNAPVFFPGTPDMSAAATITVSAGEERLGVDIPFAYLPTARVTGRLTLPSGVPPPMQEVRQARTECRMTPVGFEDLLAQPLAASVATVQPDGQLVFPGIPPGRYTIVCAAGRPSPAGGGPELTGWAETTVTVSGQDQEVALVLATPSAIAGRVEFESASSPDGPAAATQIRVRGLGKARLLRPEYTGRPGPDGTFRFPSIVPGRWVITGLPAGGWTVKSVRAGGREVESALEIGPGQMVEDLVVTFTDRPSELSGTLTDAGGRPASEYFVIAFGVDPAAWGPHSRRIQSARPASDGVFSMKGLPAGEYYLAALTDVEPGEWFSPAFLEQVVGAAVKVRVADGGKTVQSLQIAR